MSKRAELPWFLTMILFVIDTSDMVVSIKEIKLREEREILLLIPMYNDFDRRLAPQKSQLKSTDT